VTEGKITIRYLQDYIRSKDIIYYALAIANLYDIDLEQVIPRKEAINNEKHRNTVTFTPE
jgi:hypothetical protein